MDAMDNIESAGSLPSWECGLKSFTKVFKNEYLTGHSLRGSVD